MLEFIGLKNFKCFSELSIDLAGLNVFSGLNGMGKSTVIQGLLLFKQTQEQNDGLDSFFLNGNMVSLGTGNDVLYENAHDEVIGVRFAEDDIVTDVLLKYDSTSDVLNVCKPINALCKSLEADFEYISADRLSPQTTYEKSSVFMNNNKLGSNGQYTVNYLSIHERDDVVPLGKITYKTLKEGVQIWLNNISPNVKFDVSQIGKTDLAQINYYYTGLRDSTRTNSYRPTNVGFGISYVLPVITALLKAEKGSVLVIENPEAHLHPQGQRKMGELIALCVNNGVQVYLETHSDHVMNGIRIAVKDRVLSSDQVKVYFFNNNKGNTDHGVESPRILDDGRFDFWPDGFFDEWEKALDEIV